MSFIRRLEKQGECILRLIITLFLFVACTTHSTSLSTNKNNKDEHAAVKQKLTEIIHAQKNKQIQKTNKKNRIERVLGGTAKGIFRILLLPMTIAQKAIQKHAPNSGNADQAAQTISLEYQEEQIQRELSQYKDSLSVRDINSAISDPDTPARKFIEIETNKKHLNDYKIQKKEYQNQLEELYPSDHPYRRGIAKIAGSAIGGILGWIGYKKIHNYLSSPEKKKSLMENELKKTSQKIKDLTQKINEIQSSPDEKNNEKKKQLGALIHEKTQQETEQKQLLNNLTQQTYLQKSILDTVTQTTCSAIAATIGFAAAKKLTQYTPKKLSLKEQSQYAVLKTRYDKLIKDEKSLKKETQDTINTYEKMYGPLNRETIVALSLIRSKEEELKTIKAKKLLGRNPVLGTFVRYISPILQYLTGNLFPINI